EQLTLLQPSREARADERAGNGCDRADGEQRPVDAAVEVSEDTGDTEAKPNGQVRPDGTKGVLADETKQRTDPQRAEDQADEAAQDADARAGREGGGRVDVFSSSLPGSARSEQVGPEDEQGDADDRQQCGGGHLA